MYRRRISLAIVLILLLGVLSACGQSPSGDSASSSGSDPSSGDNRSESSKSTGNGSPDVSGEAVTYQAVNGEVSIPRNPQRVVVIADSYVGYFLALGIKPVAVSEHALLNPYFEGYLDGVANMGDGKSVEKILEQRPFGVYR